MAAPAQTIAWLQPRLQPIAPLDKKQVTDWLAALDDKRFAVRERAYGYYAP